MPDTVVTEQETRRDRKREWRRLRRRLVKPDLDSRPLLTLGEKTCRIPERLFLVPLILLPLAVFAIVAVEWRWEERMSLIEDSELAAVGVLTMAVVSMALVFADLASYRPRLFAVCARKGVGLVDELVSQSGDLEAVLDELGDTPPKDEEGLRSHRDDVRATIDQHLRIGGLRLRVALHVLWRLGALVTVLGFIAYALSTLANDPLIAGKPKDADLATHLYFVVSSFFPIGPGDLKPTHGAVGFSFAAGAVLTVTAIVYFVLTEIVVSQSQFRSDFRSATEDWVLIHARLSTTE